MLVLFIRNYCTVKTWHAQMNTIALLIKRRANVKVIS